MFFLGLFIFFLILAIFYYLFRFFSLIFFLFTSLFFIVFSCNLSIVKKIFFQKFFIFFNSSFFWFFMARQPLFSLTFFHIKKKLEKFKWKFFFLTWKKTLPRSFSSNLSWTKTCQSNCFSIFFWSNFYQIF